MKISLNWLRELVELPTNISNEEIGEKITLHTAELEEIVSIQTYFNTIFAAKLTKTTPHPRSNKHTIGIFDCGTQGKKQIVFGTTHSVFIGKIYPVALDGAHIGNGQTIKAGQIKGALSEGMICNNSEMGMKNENLLVFEEKNLGKSLPEICSEWNDFVFDIDNKSLTHRPDLMGHIGFSREYSAIFGTKKNTPNFSDIQQKIPKKNTPASKKIQVEITSPHCLRFMGVSVSGIKISPSDLKEMVRLENLGIRSISNIVDITNLVMIEHGQPMHAFDAHKISGKITVRPAKKGEKLLALDENEYSLTPDDIVIADEKKILSLAGIMGGLESAITENTTEIIFESANFDPSVIRKTSARLGLRSESSMRFEKSLDPENTKNGILSALKKLLTAQPSAVISSEITDIYPKKLTKKTISLSFDQVRNISGIDFSNEDIIEKLKRLDFKVLEKIPGKCSSLSQKKDPHTVLSKKSGEIIVEIPSFRATKDISIPEDLIEEIVRLHGFFRIEEKLPTLPIKPPKENKQRTHEWNIRDFMASKKYLEVYHSSFVSPEDQTWSQESDHISIINAGNNETKFLRKTLISNMVRHLENELRKHKTVSVFEIGKIYISPINQPPFLGILKAETQKNGEKLFYDLKQDIIELLEEFNLSEIKVQSPQNISKIEHPYRTAEFSFDSKNIGKIFELHPSKNPVKKSSVVYAELNLELISSLSKKILVKFKKISDFPISIRDLSIVLNKKILIRDIETTIQKNSSILTKIELFDEYRDDKKLGEELKNLSFHLFFQSNTHTLSHETIESEFSNIVKSLQSSHGVELRIDFD